MFCDTAVWAICLRLKMTVTLTPCRKEPFSRSPTSLCLFLCIGNYKGIVYFIMVRMWEFQQVLLDFWVAVSGRFTRNRTAWKLRSRPNNNTCITYRCSLLLSFENVSVYVCLQALHTMTTCDHWRTRTRTRCSFASTSAGLRPLTAFQRRYESSPGFLFLSPLSFPKT